MALCIALSIVAVAFTTDRVWGAIGYAVNAVPSTINLSQNVTITISWNGGTSRSTYTVKGTVSKANGQWAASTSIYLSVHFTRGGRLILSYAQPLCKSAPVSRTDHTHI